MQKTDIDYLKDTVRAWLSTETPRTQRELEALTGIDRRDVRKIIRELRIDGVKVCSGNAGVWIWNGEDTSWSKTKTAIARKAAHTFELLNAIKRAELLEDQITFEEVRA